MIAAAAPQIADPLVRNLGTIGGSLDPLRPERRPRRGDARRERPRDAARARAGSARSPSPSSSPTPSSRRSSPNELLTKVRITSPTGPYGGTYLKLERKVGDYATVAVAIRLMMSNGSIGTAGIGLTSVGLTNIKATAAEDSARRPGAERRAVRRGRTPRGRGLEPRDRRPRQRGVQATHGRGVRAARPRARRRDGRRGLSGEGRRASREPKGTAMEVTITRQRHRAHDRRRAPPAARARAPGGPAA